MGGPEFVDVRMRGFPKRAEVDAVLALLDARTAPLLCEVVPLLESADRVLAEPVISPVNVPGFARAAMDGYAVRAADIAETSETDPVALEIAGESLPGRPYTHELGPFEAVRIMTGAPVPAGADAVLMAEHIWHEGECHILAPAPVAVGKHVIRVGEDVAKGGVVLPAGRRLRPQDVGLLASIGAATVCVVRRPRVAILVTGNELLPPGTAPSGFQIVDSNSPMLTALAVRDGAEVLPVQRLPDDFTAIRDAIRTATADADVIFVSGGTSVGTEDHAPRAAAELGELAVHGVAVRPAGPLGVAFLGRAIADWRDTETGRHGDRETRRRGDTEIKAEESGSVLSPCLPVSVSPCLVFLLPGNPVSCLCAYDLFAGRVVRRFGGRPWELPYPKRTLRLAAPIASAAGRVDYVRVKLEANAVRLLPTGGAANLSTAVAADGFVLVPADRDHLAPGEEVEVWLYEG